MTAFGAFVTVTLRALLSRRRMLLLLALAAMPVVLGVLIRLAGGTPDAARILDLLVVQTVMPLIALVLGTSAIGSEIEDGTLVYLLAKPPPRWQLALAKLLCAALLTAALVVPPMVVCGLLLGSAGGEDLAVSFGYAVAAIAGGAAYAMAFTTLGAITSRALIIGLVYVLLWEGSLAGLLEGTRFLSIRQATLGFASALSGGDAADAPLAPIVSVGLLAIVIGGAIVLASAAMARFEVSSSD